MKTPVAALSIFFILLLINNQSFAQIEGEYLSGADQSGSEPRVLETREGEYVPVSRESMERSPAYTYSSPGFFTTQVNIDQFGMNIVGDAANEPSITFDPNNPERMAIGWRHFATINNSFRQAGVGYTSDGGLTWTFIDVIDPGVFRSDPVLDSDAEGNFYYNSLTVVSEYWCDIFKSDDGGASWSGPTFAYGGDKQWFSVDKTGGTGNGNIYNYWSSYSICDPYFFTRSTDGGSFFEDCIYILGEPYWGTTAVDGEGNLYICGAYDNDFVVVKSSTAQDPDQSVTWDHYAVVDLDGEIVGFGGFACPNPVGLLGQAIIAVDSSGGPTDGNVYLLCSVERQSNYDPLDVMFARSTDGGLTWSEPVRVNDDPGTSAWQWFGTMSVAPDGRIDAIWLDTRDDPGGVNSALYYAYSQDAGDTWSPNVRLSEFFDPHIGWPQQEKMGDYFDMFSDETGAHLAWAGTFNDEQDVYYAHITPPSTGIEEAWNDAIKNSLQSRIYPNPFRHSTTISYVLPEEEFISLKVFDMTGKEIHILVDEIQSAGPHRFRFESRGLGNGIYYYRLQAGNKVEMGRMAVVK